MTAKESPQVVFVPRTLTFIMDDDYNDDYHEDDHYYEQVDSNYSQAINTCVSMP